MRSLACVDQRFDRLAFQLAMASAQSSKSATEAPHTTGTIKIATAPKNAPHSGNAFLLNIPKEYPLI